MEEMRLQKFIANSGVCSRRKAEEYILAGKVKINGKIVTELGTKVDPQKDEVIFNNKKIKGNSLLKTGIVVSIGLAIHNIPEGLAIGTGFEASMKLGYSLAIAIAIHDIPEGISMAAPMKKGGLKSGKILFYVILSGVTTGLGAFVGAIVGNISQKVIAVCLALAAGAMLYIVSGELTPEYNKLYSGKMSSIGNMIGFILGLIATQI